MNFATNVFPGCTLSTNEINVTIRKLIENTKSFDEKYKHFVIIRTTTNQLLLVNPQDRYIGRTLISTGEWEPHIVYYYKQLIKPGMVVIDIGANIGSHTVLFSDLVGINGKVIAFEPCKINHDVLLYNCCLNKCDNVEIHKLGCGDRKETMYIDKKWRNTENLENYGCVCLTQKQDSDEDEKINVVSVDDMNIGKVHFMKVDAENMEDKVLLGCKETIARYRPVMIIEIHEEDKAKVEKILNDFVYTVIFIGIYDYIAVPTEMYKIK